MQNEEAINILKQDIDISFQGLIDDDFLNEEDIKHIKAYEMAIEALKAQKVGKWDVYVDCEGKTRTISHKECGFKSGQYTWKNYNFCPHCGARMAESEGEK